MTGTRHGTYQRVFRIRLKLPSVPADGSDEDGDAEEQHEIAEVGFVRLFHIFVDVLTHRAHSANSGVGHMVDVLLICG